MPMNSNRGRGKAFTGVRPSFHRSLPPEIGPTALLLHRRLPGLTEICRHCTKNLEVPKTLAGTLPATFAQQKLSTTFPSLIGVTGVSSPVKGHSRLVFVASGGVFRGSFHIGNAGGA